MSPPGSLGLDDTQRTVGKNGVAYSPSLKDVLVAAHNLSLGDFTTTDSPFFFFAKSGISVCLKLCTRDNHYLINSR